MPDPVGGCAGFLMPALVGLPRPGSSRERIHRLRHERPLLGKAASFRLAPVPLLQKAPARQKASMRATGRRIAGLNGLSSQQPARRARDRAHSSKREQTARIRGPECFKCWRSSPFGGYQLQRARPAAQRLLRARCCFLPLLLHRISFFSPVSGWPAATPGARQRHMH
jgi:hypothetical protein